MSLLFVKAGLQTSLQDFGRHGLQHLGIASSGAMDTRSMQMANYLLGKPLDSAVIEVTLVGPTIQATQAISVAICGAQFDLILNQNKVACNQVINLNKGDTLAFKQCKRGARAYLAFTGELSVEPVLGSYSTHLTAKIGCFKGALSDNQLLEISASHHPIPKQLPEQFLGFYSGNYLIRCVPSLETELFNQTQIKQFYSQTYTVSVDANRMGIRLQGNPMVISDAINITSSGLTQGSIQIPPSGEAIISSVDGQTIGGYPRLANIVAADLPLLGQLRAHDKINFTLVDLDYADQLLTESNSLMEQLNH